MSPRTRTIIEAASQMFLRYGIKRTSMNDIAQQAGVARQTLYNAFSTKEDLVQAALANYAAQSMLAVGEAIDNGAALPELLDLYFLKMTIEPFELLAVNPNAEDLLEGINALSKEAMAISFSGYIAMATRILAPYETAITAAGSNVKALAELLQASGYGAKKMARDRQHLESLLKPLKYSISHMIATNT